MPLFRLDLSLVVLRRYSDQVIPRRQWLSYEAEGPIDIDERHIETVHHHSRRRIRLSSNLDHVTVLNERL